MISSLRFGWDTFKKRPWFFIGVTVFVLVISAVVNPGHAQQGTMLSGSWISDVWDVVAVLLLVVLDMGTTSLMLHAHDDVASVRFSDLWHPHPYWKYFAAVLIMGVGIVVGLCLCILPGIYLLLLCMFVKFCVIDKNLGPISALKQSAQLGAGKRWELLLFVLSLILLNVLGAIVLLVGLLVTIPVTGIATAHAYRSLSKRSDMASSHA